MQLKLMQSGNTRDRYSAKTKKFSEKQMELRFDDFEQYREATSGWGLEFVQLDKGRFLGILREATASKVSITHFNLNRHFHQQGEIRKPGRTFAIFLDRITPMKWQNTPEVYKDTLVVFPADGALEAVSFPGFNAVSISIDVAFLENVAQQYDLLVTLEHLPRHAVNYPTDGYIIDKLRVAVRSLIERVQPGTPPYFLQELETEIARLVLNALAARLPYIARPPDNRRRDRAFIAAVDAIRELRNPNLTVPELSKLVGVSQRTLRYTFSERLSVSPQAYIKAQRLAKVRELLLSQPTGDSPVMDIAAQFGFWHTGQFASDYKAVFGELPSTTVERSGTDRDVKPERSLASTQFDHKAA